jgi:hypothetical protein
VILTGEATDGGGFGSVVDGELSPAVLEVGEVVHGVLRGWASTRA